MALHEASNFNGISDEGLWVERQADFSWWLGKEQASGFGDLKFAVDTSFPRVYPSGVEQPRAGGIRSICPHTGFHRHVPRHLASDASGELQLTARSGDEAPGFSDGTVFRVLRASVQLNDAGQMAFNASLGPTGVEDQFQSSIWRADPAGDLRMIAREGDPAPDRIGGA